MSGSKVKEPGDHCQRGHSRTIQRVIDNKLITLTLCQPLELVVN